jgi:hypothetical protein
MLAYGEAGLHRSCIMAMEKILRETMQPVINVVDREISRRRILIPFTPALLSYPKTSSKKEVNSEDIHDRSLLFGKTGPITAITIGK